MFDKSMRVFFIDSNFFYLFHLKFVRATEWKKMILLYSKFNLKLMAVPISKKHTKIHKKLVLTQKFLLDSILF